MHLDKPDEARGAKKGGPGPAAGAGLSIPVPAPKGFTFPRSIIEQIATKPARVARDDRIQKYGYLNERFFPVAKHQAPRLENLASLLEEDPQPCNDQPPDELKPSR